MTYGDKSHLGSDVPLIFLFRLAHLLLTRGICQVQRLSVGNSIQLEWNGIVLFSLCLFLRLPSIYGHQSWLSIYGSDIPFILKIAFSCQEKKKERSDFTLNKYYVNNRTGGTWLR